MYPECSGAVANDSKTVGYIFKFQPAVNIIRTVVLLACLTGLFQKAKNYYYYINVGQNATDRANKIRTL